MLAVRMEADRSKRPLCKPSNRHVLHTARTHLIHEDMPTDTHVSFLHMYMIEQIYVVIHSCVCRDIHVDTCPPCTTAPAKTYANTNHE